MVLLVTKVIVGCVHTQVINVCDVIRVWLATVSEAVSKCVTQCYNLHNIQSKYGHVGKQWLTHERGARSILPKVALKYDANGNNGYGWHWCYIHWEAALEWKDYTKLKLWRSLKNKILEKSYSTVLSSSTSWHSTVVKLSSAQKCVLEKMWILQYRYLNYRTSVYVIVLVNVLIGYLSTLSGTCIGSIGRECWPWSARLYIIISTNTDMPHQITPDSNHGYATTQKLKHWYGLC